MKTTRLVLPLVLILLLTLGVPVFPQSQPADAHLSGSLTDPSGAGVGNVCVTAQLEATAGAPFWSATSSTDGAYNLSVPPGRYHVHFALDPFAPRDVVLDLSEGASRTVSFRLELQTLSDKVLVTAQAEPIRDQQSSAPVSIVPHEEIAQRQSVFF